MWAASKGYVRVCGLSSVMDAFVIDKGKLMGQVIILGLYIFFAVRLGL